MKIIIMFLYFPLNWNNTILIILIGIEGMSMTNKILYKIVIKSLC